MSSGTTRDEPGEYELRVGRHLDDRWAEWFGDLTMTREPDGTTTLRGPVADQAALHGILIKIRDLGMVLLAVRTHRRCTTSRVHAAATASARRLTAILRGRCPPAPPELTQFLGADNGRSSAVHPELGVDPLRVSAHRVQ